MDESPAPLSPGQEAHALLWWIPVGAGSAVVPHTSRLWEWCRARLAGERPRPLFHAALEIVVDGERYLIEMAPAWGVPAESRGVVTTGPVGVNALGASRFFRYEVRCWRDGVLPDRSWAVGGPVRIGLSPAQGRAAISAVSRVPRLVWGRKPTGVREMWNSNSLVAWLLETVGINATQFTPPDNGSAPGWAAGIAVARSS